MFYQAGIVVAQNFFFIVRRSSLCSAETSNMFARIVTVGSLLDFLIRTFLRSLYHHILLRSIVSTTLASGTEREPFQTIIRDTRAIGTRISKSKSCWFSASHTFRILANSDAGKFENCPLISSRAHVVVLRPC